MNMVFNAKSGVQFIVVLASEGRNSFAFLKKFACKPSHEQLHVPKFSFLFMYVFHVNHGMKICYFTNVISIIVSATYSQPTLLSDCHLP